MTTARKFTTPLALLGLALGGAVIAASINAFGAEAQGWQLAARYTARTSFALFLLVYLTAPLALLIPSSSAIKRERRGLGLAFAGAHFMHLGALITYLQVSGHPPALLTVTFGGIGYALIALMALTSNDASVRTLGPANWRRLHTFGLHYTWFIFVVTYVRRIAAYPDMPEYVVLLTLGALALVIRFAAPFAVRKPSLS